MIQGRVQANMLVGFLVSLCASTSVSALAQMDSGTVPYTPPQTEQPVYGKKYRPSEIRSDTYLEINPLLLMRRGIGIEFETRLRDNSSIGLDFAFESDEKKTDGVKNNYNYWSLAPKIRLYPMDSLTGLFLGGKLHFGSVSLKQSDGISPEKEESGIVVSPTAHVGYRLTRMGGITISLYAGGGVNLSEVEMEGNLGDGYAKGREFLNDKVSRFRPDFGLTIGGAF